MISKRLLGFLIPAFIASLIYGYMQMPRQERITGRADKVIQGSAAQKRGQSLKSAKTGDSYPLLRSDLLERKSQPYLGVRHDLFFSALTAGQEEDVIDIPPEEPPAEVVVQPVVIPPPPPPPPPPSPQEVARKELSQYKFVGFYKKGEKQTIFLSSSGEIFLVRKGDYLGRDRKYYVLNITDTILELRKEGAGDFSIKLSDQESLSAVSLRGEKPLEHAPASPRSVQEMDLPDQPEFLTVPDEEPQDEEPIQPEEDNNETQN